MDQTWHGMMHTKDPHDVLQAVRVWWLLLEHLVRLREYLEVADRAVLQECVREQKLRVAQAMWLCRWRLLSRLRLGSEILREGNLLVRELF